MKRQKPTLQSSTNEARHQKMLKIISELERLYEDPHCALTHETPFQLLSATILSAQCTDARVNIVTPHLFERYGTPEKMAKARVKDLEKIIQSTGFFRNKALSLLEAARAIVKNHGGRVPATLEELTALRGVGRKTANVVLGNAYGIPGLVVDTHVGRLCRRMGFTEQTNPEKVESEMMELVPREKWTNFSHLLISHGRAICMARRPQCEDCVIRKYCSRVGLGS